MGSGSAGPILSPGHLSAPGSFNTLPLSSSSDDLSGGSILNAGNCHQDLSFFMSSGCHTKQAFSLFHHRIDKEQG
jgi:hypothetical protein